MCGSIIVEEPSPSRGVGLAPADVDDDAPFGHAAELMATLRGLSPTVAALGRLEAALTGFAERPGPVGPGPWNHSAGRYPRVLLNDPADPFQAIVCFWPPGARSAIHDHADTVGGVVALFGEVAETKYAVRERDDGRVELQPEQTCSLRRGCFTPILPEDGKQLHDMRNEGLEWGATLHVYLRPIVRFGVYCPADDRSYRREERSLWFDFDHGAATWDRHVTQHREAVPVEHDHSHRGACSCGAVEVASSAGPVLQVGCHCRDCQHAHGTTRTPWAFFSAPSVWITKGSPRRFTYDNDSGYRITRTMCRHCGTAVLFESEGSPQLRGVPAGVLDDRGFFRSEIELYIGSAPTGTE